MSDKCIVANTISLIRCTETIGARYSAGVACLLGCAFNNCTGGEKKYNIDLCERECNNRFMSLRPIDQKWIELDSAIQACPT
jgi:hypothetical protein